jgi:hypothetical protein
MNTSQASFSWAKLALALAVGLGVGMVGQRLLRPAVEAGHPGSAASAPAAAHGTQGPAGQGAGALSTADAPTPRPTVALLDVNLRLPDDPTPVGDGKVALPAGTRFLVEVKASKAGTLTATTSRGQASASGAPLWQTPVAASSWVKSPVMRLAGPTGLEHLDLVLKDAQGQILAERRLDIWHQ